MFPELEDEIFDLVDDFMPDASDGAFLAAYADTASLFASHLSEQIKETGGSHMPVLNEKTGEMDYADVNLIDKVKLEPIFIQDLTSSSSHKISMSIRWDKENEVVVLDAECETLPFEKGRYMTSMSLQIFEEIMFEAIHNVVGQQIEDVERFKAYLDICINMIIGSLQNQKIFLHRNDTVQSFNTGVGIIRDVKLGLDVGTFESFDVVSKGNRISYVFKEPMMTNGAVDTLDDKGRYSFRYHSLDKFVLFTAESTDTTDIKVESDLSVHMDISCVLLEEFGLEHSYREPIAFAYEAGRSARSYETDHPSFERASQDSLQARLDLIESSKKKQKQEKLMSQFSDLDLGF